MDPNVEIEECVTMIQFNELKQSIEAKQDLLAQDLQTLMAEIRGRRRLPDGVRNHDEDGEKVKEIILEGQVNMGGEIEVLHVVEEEAGIEEIMTI